LSDRETAGAMGVRAAALAKREFDVGLIVESYVAVYYELLGRFTGNRLHPIRAGRRRLRGIWVREEKDSRVRMG
jgi:hypothetical protein